MKRLIFFLLLLFLVLPNAILFAQDFKGYYQETKSNYLNQTNKFSLEVGAQTNRSIRGWRNGWAIDLVLSNKLKVGYYNTEGKTIAELEARTDRGVQLGYLFNAKGKLSFGPDVKVNVTDKRFISVIPMLHFRYEISERLRLKSGIGLSDRYPIFDFGVNFRIK